MARKKSKKNKFEIDILPESDDFIFGTHPRKTLGLIGHQQTIEKITDIVKSGRIPQAFLLSGPKGIGKATFIYHFIRAFETHGFNLSCDHFNMQDQDNLYNKMACLSLGNLKILRRQFNTKTQKFYNAIRMDDLKVIKPFFSLAAFNGAYRYCVIDCADDMMHGSASVSNALLKTLEEPPEKTIFFLITHQVGTILPTIRSRTMHLPMQQLSHEEIKLLCEKHSLLNNKSDAEKEQLFKLSSGSVRQALLFSDSTWIKLLQAIKKSLLQAIPIEQLIQRHAIQEKFYASVPINETLMILRLIFLTAIQQFFYYLIQEKKQLETIYTTTHLYEKMHHLFIDSSAYNISPAETLDTAFTLLKTYHFKISQKHS